MAKKASKFTYTATITVKSDVKLNKGALRGTLANEASYGLDSTTSSLTISKFEEAK